jgi:DNA invertase Pin-like site-specific DNA recombinase
MNALFLKDLADRTRRGLRGRVEAGRSGGGNSYGYDVVKRFAGDGTPQRGDRTVNEAQAAIVQRIFSEYAGGKSSKAIAKQLNREGVRGPSGKGWGHRRSTATTSVAPASSTTSFISAGWSGIGCAI